MKPAFCSLNHTRIATLYGLEAHDGQRFLVMELVPGQTLAERLRHGPLPIRDALDVCRQIAEGLEAAHEAGIVHRDLKPANIKVTPDGRVKLLDFGLAKALDSAPSGVEPTVAAVEATREGTVLGTPAYMSPEQARGQLVDRRADIWAFGCCLYECLTAGRAFRGNTVTDTLAAVLNSDPDWDAVSEIPLAVRRLLRRALAKDVRQRLQHIGDARLELEETEPRANDSSAGARRSSQNVLAVALGALLLVVVAAVLVFWPRGGQTNATAKTPVSRLTLKSKTQRWVTSNCQSTGSLSLSQSHPMASVLFSTLAAGMGPNSFFATCRDSTRSRSPVPKMPRVHSFHQTAAGWASGVPRIGSCGGSL